MTKIDCLSGKQKRFKALPSADSIIARVGRCKSSDKDNEFKDFRVIDLRSVYTKNPFLAVQKNTFLQAKNRIELILETVNT